jgi:hypothetical protein
MRSALDQVNVCHDGAQARPHVTPQRSSQDWRLERHLPSTGSGCCPLRNSQQVNQAMDQANPDN